MAYLQPPCWQHELFSGAEADGIVSERDGFVTPVRMAVGFSREECPSFVARVGDASGVFPGNHWADRYRLLKTANAHKKNPANMIVKARKG